MKELRGSVASYLSESAKERPDQPALVSGAKKPVFRSLSFLELDRAVDALARRMAELPVSQLVMLKMLVNQAFENMGLRTTQILGTMFDGAARHTPEGVAWRELAMKEGFREAVRRRDAPFGDYGEEEKT